MPMGIDCRGDSGITTQVRLLFGVGPLSGLSDEELLDRFLARTGEGSELAFAALLERHASMVLAVCRRVLEDACDVEDAFQATFVILVRRARTIRNHGSLASWLHGVAYRLSCSARSAAVRRRRHEQRHAELAGRSDSPTRVETLDLKAIVDAELLRLPERYRRVVVLCDLEDLSYEQAARTLSLPVGTVKSRLARGRESLRARLGRRGVSPLSAVIGTAEAPAKLLRSTAQAAEQVAARTALAGGLSARVLSLAEGGIRTMVLNKAKSALVVLAVSGSMISLTGWLAGGVLRVRASEQEPRAESASTAKIEVASKPASRKDPLQPVASPPGLPGPPIPAPWETAVRIQILDEHSVGFASGTIIRSTRDESLILTASSPFKLDGPSQVPPRDFPKKVQVDLFDGKLSYEPPHVRFQMRTGGEVVDYDFDHLIALVRIRPGRQLPSSPIVPRRWEPKLRMLMLNVGCSDGNDPTPWQTVITQLAVQLSSFPAYEGIACRSAPKQGRTGGGLFTTDGYLAGICSFSEPKGDRGIYVAPKAIHRLLDRNGLSELYSDRTKAVDFSAGLPDGSLNHAETQSAAPDMTIPRPDAEPAISEPPPMPGTPPSVLGEPSPEAETTGHGRIGGFIFAASPSGNRLVAYDPISRRSTAIELKASKDHPLRVSFAGQSGSRSSIIAPTITGSKIRRIAAFDLTSSTWYAHDLVEPVDGNATPVVTGEGSIAYDLGPHLYTFNKKNLTWDHFDASAIPESAGDAGTGEAKQVSPVGKRD
ncbi:RNA polymerase sigma factor [Aquisphaera insulae]|uniref:RNA polymerase sigma factor n=1 Tax=Aquisphaera insulae TaxID=2712864 RepID=UPI0013EA3B15|nr:sigma-70 family RNA polymerase sigma factor [Aquisphaera insulae]